MTNSPTRQTIKNTVEAMINEIGLLRQMVAIDNMPIELQQVRQLLRQLESRLDSN